VVYGARRIFFGGKPVDISCPPQEDLFEAFLVDVHQKEYVKSSCLKAISYQVPQRNTRRLETNLD